MNNHRIRKIALEKIPEATEEHPEESQPEEENNNRIKEKHMKIKNFITICLLLVSVATFAQKKLK